MANTTNYNWETPDDTDLVKDGAAAIRTLGSSVDTTTKALNPSTTLGDIEYRSATANTNTRLGIGTTGQVLTVAGGVPTWATSDDANAIQNAIVDAKGDLIAASAADTPARLAVGANGTVLTADSAEATGLKWAAPAGGTSGLTLIDEVSFTASSTINVNDVFSSTYTNYRILISGSSSTGSDCFLNLRFRVSGTDTTTNYKSIRIYGENSAAGSDFNASGTDDIPLFSMGNSSFTAALGTYDITKPNVAAQSGVSGLGGGTSTNNASMQMSVVHGAQTDSTQFTGFTIIGSTTATGVVSIYGYQKE